MLSQSLIPYIMYFMSVPCFTFNNGHAEAQQYMHTAIYFAPEDIINWVGLSPKITNGEQENSEPQVFFRNQFNK
jgi:hypothetical protein